MSTAANDRLRNPKWIGVKIRLATKLMPNSRAGDTYRYCLPSACAAAFPFGFPTAFQIDSFPERHQRLVARFGMACG